MRAKTMVVLGFAVMTSLASASAEDTPAQAAARAVLVQRLSDLDAQAPIAPLTTSPQPAQIVTNRPVATTNSEKAVDTPVITTPPAPAKAAAPKAFFRPASVVVPGNEITTVTGVSYKNVHLEKVESDGIVISYALPNGGMAMAKIYAKELPPALRQKYGLSEGQ